MQLTPVFERLSASLSRRAPAPMIAGALVVATCSASPAARADGVAKGTAAAAIATEESPVVASASAGTGVYADTDHVTVVTPTANAAISDRLSVFSLRGSYLVDVISAASVDIVSTASQRWHEVRQAGTVDAAYQPGNLGVRASGAVSSEPDYVSFAGGGTLIWDFFQKSHTLFAGYAHAHDRIGRTGTSFDVYSHPLNSDTVSAGITLTLNRSAALSFVGDASFERGDQSKPYRYIPMFSDDVARTVEKGASIDEVNQKRLPARPLEQLPLARSRYALTARFGYRFRRSTLRIDERLYADSWRLHASTTEIRYFIDVSRRLELWPRLRAHVQSPVYFWDRAYTARLGSDGVLDLPRYRTGDRELGPLETLGGGIGATLGLGSDDDPSRFSATLELAAMNTQFFDDLYITSRTSGLATLGLQGSFE